MRAVLFDLVVAMLGLGIVAIVVELAIRASGCRSEFRWARDEQGHRVIEFHVWRNKADHDES